MDIEKRSKRGRRLGSSTGINLNGSKIQELRVGKNLSQAELAEDAGLSKGLISQIETGRNRLSRLSLDSVARVLGVDSEQLVSPVTSGEVSQKGLTPEEADLLLSKMKELMARSALFHERFMKFADDVEAEREFFRFSPYGG